MMRQIRQLYRKVTSTMSTYPKNAAAWSGVLSPEDTAFARAPILIRTFSQQQSSKSIEAFATADAVQPTTASAEQAYKKESEKDEPFSMIGCSEQ